jgi:ABC-type multidrug transport system ATPase subunit
MTLKLTGVRKWLGSRAVIDGVDLTVDAGEIAVIRGENGAGKSTLLRLVVGMLHADAGEIRLGLHSLAGDGVAYKMQLGYVPDSTDAFPDLRVGEYLSLVQSFRRSSRSAANVHAEWRERLGVNQLARERVSALSFGQRKRMCTAAALGGDPWLLVLDEPSNGLDPDGVDLIVALLRSRAESGKAVLCSTNDEAFADRVGGARYALAGGKLGRVVSHR